MTGRKRSASDGNDIIKKVVGVTKGKKEMIVDQSTVGHFFIKFKDGGQLPVELTGRYTRYEFAIDHINSYLAGK